MPPTQLGLSCGHCRHGQVSLCSSCTPASSQMLCTPDAHNGQQAAAVGTTTSLLNYKLGRLMTMQGFCRSQTRSSSFQHRGLSSLPTASSTLPPHLLSNPSSLSLPQPAQSPKLGWSSGGWTSAHAFCLPDSSCTVAAAGRALQPLQGIWTACSLLLFFTACTLLAAGAANLHRSIARSASRVCQQWGCCWQHGTVKGRAQPDRHKAITLSSSAEARQQPQFRQQRWPQSKPAQQWLKPSVSCRASLGSAQRLALRAAAWLGRPRGRGMLAGIAVLSAAATWCLAPGAALGPSRMTYMHAVWRCVSVAGMQMADRLAKLFLSDHCTDRALEGVRRQGIWVTTAAGMAQLCAWSACMAVLSHALDPRHPGSPVTAEAHVLLCRATPCANRSGGHILPVHSADPEL